MKHDDDIEDDGGGGDGEQALQVPQQGQRQHDEHADTWKGNSLSSKFCPGFIAVECFANA